MSDIVARPRPTKRKALLPRAHRSLGLITNEGDHTESRWLWH